MSDQGGGAPGGARPTVASGRVAAFDRDVGLGVVRADDGTELGFHCTQIAGGSRDIAAGTPVRFEVVAGRRGRWEAAGVTPTAVA